MKSNHENGTFPRLGSGGQTIVIVVVLMLVFFILGASVLSAAAGTAAAQSRRAVNTQTYYYAASMLDALDADIDGGSLAQRLLSDAFSAAAGSSGSVEGALDANDVLLGSERIGRLSIEYTGNVSFKNNNNADVTLSSVSIKPTAEYSESSFSFTAKYRLTANAKRTAGTWGFEDITCVLLGLK